MQTRNAPRATRTGARVSPFSIAALGSFRCGNFTAKNEEQNALLGRCLNGAERRRAHCPTHINLQRWSKATKLHQFLAAALLGGAMCFAGPSFAAKSTTTDTHTAATQHKAANVSLKQKASSRAATQPDSKEQSTTADLNRASLAKAAQGQTSANEQTDTMQQAMLEDEEDLLLMQRAMLENDDGTAVD